MSEHGCVKAVINCMEETPGNAKMVLSVKNYCEDYATKDQIEEIKEILAEQMVEGPGCQGENMEEKNIKEDPKVLLIGPSSGSDGRSEVLSLPDLTPLDCNVPVFPVGKYQDYYGYVGRVTSDGVLMCGGYTDYDYTSSCHLLTSSGYQDMPGLINKRSDAASVVTPLGLWVTGGYDGDQILDTTEIWNNNQSQPHVRLPDGRRKHCLVSLNNTHALLTGGYTQSEESAAAFIYSERNGFTRIADMKTTRTGHGCSVINDNTVVVAGGLTKNYRPTSSTEYLNINSLTWAEGPELPQTVWQAKILGPEELGPEVGGHLLIGVKKIFKLEEKGLTQTRQWTEVREMSRELGQAFVVNQNMFC